jgi:hypothetical protein
MQVKDANERYLCSCTSPRTPHLTQHRRSTALSVQGADKKGPCGVAPQLCRACAETQTLFCFGVQTTPVTSWALNCSRCSYFAVRDLARSFPAPPLTFSARVVLRARAGLAGLALGLAATFFGEAVFFAAGLALALVTGLALATLFLAGLALAVFLGATAFLAGDALAFLAGDALPLALGGMPPKPICTASQAPVRSRRKEGYSVQDSRAADAVHLTQQMHASVQGRQALYPVG